MSNPLSELFSMLAEEQKKQEKENVKITQLSNFVESLVVVDKKDIPEQIQEELDILEPEDVSNQIEEMVRQVKERALAELKEEGRDIFGKSSSTKTQDPLTSFEQKFATKDELQKHYSQFLTRIQQQLSTIGGGGEVKFLRLDDVDASTVGPNKHLAYNPTTGKVFFEDVIIGEINDDGYTTEVTNNTVSVINLPANTAIGPVEQLSFNTSHTHQEERVVGTLCWDPDDQTLNLTHPNDVVQQIGQELYAYVRNGTANTIVNGTAVQFAGAEHDGTARLLIAPMLADGTYPSLYGLGIATEDIAPGEDGRVTVWGKVRDLDMSAFNVGDILYVSANTAGEFTNVKPTAPNNVIPVAAVLNNSNTAGEIFVRPTINQQQSYGRFARKTDVAITTTNTANTVQFDTTEISNGVSIVTDNTSRLQVNQSGLYQIDISAQVDASGGGFSSGTMYMWLRKNGSDIADSTRRQGVLGSAPSATISFTLSVSLDANDYIEVAFAGSSTALSFDSATATAFAPSTAAVLVGVTQIQL